MKDGIVANSKTSSCRSSRNDINIFFPVISLASKKCHVGTITSNNWSFALWFTSKAMTQWKWVPRQSKKRHINDRFAWISKTMCSTHYHLHTKHLYNKANYYTTNRILISGSDFTKIKISPFLFYTSSLMSLT